MTGSFTGSFSGSFVGSARSVDGRGGVARRKKGKKEKEKDREREGTGSVKNAGGARTESGSVTGSMRAGEGLVDEEDDEELGDEELGDGGLLGGDDAAADAIAEKENLAYVYWFGKYSMYMLTVRVSALGS